ncbi:uncharacterized protein K460DRAFT_177783 [Cucurbitaria berberidis CBS 394.84]|uniref:Uncharacterized protein n=1 Tax=Cucurbitaria berberidis CBS 394.84 TaxID=1168544 RepID=A0A9P4GA73_9PLEO|nr:uncharacterized protein K460DRAFT_177783 [Cucurbitaria berberidis CBS 394.84]KAF1842023.1 hypothetical protein K460DRAFT_177783 [Cucurbitaria berberidis CBS 394.84]
MTAVLESRSWIPVSLIRPLEAISYVLLSRWRQASSVEPQAIYPLLSFISVTSSVFRALFLARKPLALLVYPSMYVLFVASAIFCNAFILFVVDMLDLLFFGAVHTFRFSLFLFTTNDQILKRRHNIASQIRKIFTVETFGKERPINAARVNDTPHFFNTFNTSRTAIFSPTRLYLHVAWPAVVAAGITGTARGLSLRTLYTQATATSAKGTARHLRRHGGIAHDDPRASALKHANKLHR